MKLRLRQRGWISRMYSRFARAPLAVGGLCLGIGMQLANAQTFTVLYSFQDHKDGRNPQVGLVTDAIYGTSFLGGDPACACGAVFKLSSNGSFKTLHAFVGTDGANPAAGLIADKQGNLYGTTSQGGPINSGAGTVFKLTAPATLGGTWTETVLHSFGGADGAHPVAGVVQDSAGNLYGTTNEGGAFNNGTVFKLDVAGNQTVLYSFNGSPDGVYPYGAVTLDGAGNLYGTTTRGGAFNSGTVFKIDATGKETVLYSFSGGSDGSHPSSALALDAAGNLYGTANEGGATGDQGTIFELSAAGSFSVLHSLTGGVGGANPAAGMILSSTGSLYGTTSEGGDYDDDGTVFELNPATGTFTVLHIFTSGNGGTYPYTNVVLDSTGNLYGGTEGGGTARRGLVYKIVP